MNDIKCSGTSDCCGKCIVECEFCHCNYVKPRLGKCNLVKSKCETWHPQWYLDKYEGYCRICHFFRQGIVKKEPVMHMVGLTNVTNDLTGPGTHVTLAYCNHCIQRKNMDEYERNQDAKAEAEAYWKNQSNMVKNLRTKSKKHKPSRKVKVPNRKIHHSTKKIHHISKKS